MRYIRYLILAALAVALVTVALANRAPVLVQALPADLAAVTGLTLALEVPLFVVLFGGIVAGVLIGFVWEWLREHKHRSTAATRAREVSRLERELAVLRDQKAQPADEVLALIEKPRKAG
jgi:uncharacterized integral membrane protein